jgi:hypothetical protein
MGFPKGTKPYLILLDETLTSPFIPQLKEMGEKPKKDKKEDKKEEGPKEVKLVSFPALTECFGGR